MKREFLQNLKVGDQALPKEVIDAIMAENGRDIEDAKKPFADYETIKTQLKTAKDGLKALPLVSSFLCAIICTSLSLFIVSQILTCYRHNNYHRREEISSQNM